MSTYIYQDPKERAVFGPLAEGDYTYAVASCGVPYQKNDKWIVSVRLSIQPGGETVFCNPWSGNTKEGEYRDGIAEFLQSCNRAPKAGTEPDWDIEGARGRCRLKIEIAKLGALAGKEVNRVERFYAPKQVGPTTGQRPKTHSQQELNQARRETEKNAGGLGQAPDDIAFIYDRG